MLYPKRVPIVIPRDVRRRLIALAKQIQKRKELERSYDKAVDRRREGWELHYQGLCAEWIGCLQLRITFKRIVHSGGDGGIDGWWCGATLDFKSIPIPNRAVLFPKRNVSADILVGVECEEPYVFEAGQIAGMISSRKAAIVVVAAKTLNPKWWNWAIEQRHLVDYEEAQRILEERRLAC